MKSFRFYQFLTVISSVSQCVLVPVMRIVKCVGYSSVWPIFKTRIVP